MANHNFVYATGMVIESITVPLDAQEQEVFAKARQRLKKIGQNPAQFSYSLFKRSVDARDRTNVQFVYSVLALSQNGTYPANQALLQRQKIRLLQENHIVPEYGQAPLTAPPLVVGMGPAGLFAALMLAQNGYRPIIIDRGDCVTKRVRTVERFYQTHHLDVDSNIQFGAGGAGTFSDGKLMTRIHDSKCTYVLNTMVEHGAPADILLLSKPHVGTDMLRNVVDSILKKIQDLGGTVLYRCRLDDFDQNADTTVTAHTTLGDLHCSSIVLAIGHSARDTYQMLLKKQLELIAKPISVGVRIEHLTKDIDRALYGDFAGHPLLGHAEYALSDTRTQRGVYSFCMCPGGEVMAAASEHGGLVVNGMSNRARDGRNSNSAIVVSLGCQDYEPVNGSLVEGAIALQRSIEAKAFALGGSDYTAPIQTVGDYLKGRVEHTPNRVTPTYMNGRCKLADLSQVFPAAVNRTLRYGFEVFDSKIQGFAATDAILTGAETRTSAPVRIQRSEQREAIGFSYIYPCGEGAGYAGGITSAAVDGVNTALAVMKRSLPFSN
ncbi:MAG: NAD(P)/FAD-dependent oxidoreductase [Clostridia bacterium]|nr:NAD(P)/FAD-dependent oxidoreductase [Clostridia bacterium]